MCGWLGLTLISIHAPRVGSDGIFAAAFCCAVISIHAPRVGSDAVHVGHHIARGGISIHAPRVGSDLT